ncbi:kinase domain protein [Aspergillus welwitschiae]|uniref:non-specific serine/threonine protein kinase n=1 Tax=Aspergillus welwitschiae TaxID=1341132 RepID=A0A3F3Q305_9EURO|nr:kinase domain protein [Aspergillus welwitschiae]RDH33501.1 kinase domain protein [Aspergillus welwitschiae]
MCSMAWCNLKITLPAAELIEEECTPRYTPNHYYPVRLYEILNDRYQITAKLGWGTSSTVWLARDLNPWRWCSARYLAVKIKANNYATKEDAERDVRITEKITHANPQHVGRNFVSTLLDSFDVPGPHGLHVCLLFDPLCEPLWMLKQRFHGDVLPLDVFKPVAKLILEGLGYLHSQCHIVHTDLKSDNILMALQDHSILDKVSQDENKEPLPQKQLEDRTICVSRNHFGVEANGLGRPMITDFGLAIDGSRAHYHPIQPDSFRAPEGLILGQEAHLARIKSVLGTPPVDMLREAKYSSRYFDAERRFKHPELISESGGFEKILSGVEGDDKQAFLDLVSRMLRWRADERDTVQGLLSDPWFQGL